MYKHSLLQKGVPSKMLLLRVTEHQPALLPELQSVIQKYLGALFPGRHAEPPHVLVPLDFRATYRTAFILVNLVESELIGLMKPRMPQDTTSPPSACPAKHTYLQGLAEYACTRSSAAFVSKQG